MNLPMDHMRRQDELSTNEIVAPAKQTIRILAVLEGTTVVSGVSKNLLQFGRIVNEVERSAIDLAIATFERPHQRVPGSPHSIEPFLKAARASNICVHRIPEGFRFDPCIVTHLNRLIDHLKPDVIQTHAPKSHFLVRASGIHKRVAWIAFYHGHTNTVWHSPIQNQLDRYSFRAAAKVVTVSNDFKRRLVQQGLRDDRISVLYNAVRTGDREVPTHPEVLGRNKQAIGFSPEERIIVAVGRLSREKAQIDLVLALHELRRVKPELNVRLVLIGDGPERAKIQNTADSLNLTDRVTLTGHRHDVAPYYAAADLVAIPSHSEGSPNVLLEAMAWGAPVVATTVGGIPEMVKDRETALLVPPLDPVSMAAAIVLVLSDKELAAALARRARAEVESNYSPEFRAKSLLTIYRQVLRSRNQLTRIYSEPTQTELKSVGSAELL